MKTIAVFIFLVTAKYLISLEVVPEATKIVYANPKYVMNASLTVRRYGRHSPYVVNAEGTTLVTFDDNITMDIIFYEYLHNEYKRSFIELHFKGCRNVLSDNFIGDIFKNKGISCPLLPGHYILGNMSFTSIPSVENMPYKWPFQKGKIVAIVRSYPSRETVVEAYGIAKFIDTKQHVKKIN